MKGAVLLLLFCFRMYAGVTQLVSKDVHVAPDIAAGKYFYQEYHEAYPVGNTAEMNQVKSIGVDGQSRVWIATAAGIYMKKPGDTAWLDYFDAADKGPAYTVTLDRNEVWMGNWKGVYRFKNDTLEFMPGSNGPIAVTCASREGIYALGPQGVWLYNGKECVKKNYPIARSVRSAISDGKKGLWITTDVGLYHADSAATRYIHKTDQLISASLKGLAFDPEKNLWVAGLGGVNIIRNGKRQKAITPTEGCPSVYVNTVRRSPQHAMWVGTQVGVVRYNQDGSHSLLFSRRWLLHDEVNDIAFDREGNAWIATAGGVSAIKRKKTNLSGKQDYFYDVLMKRHIRQPWIAGQCRLPVPGDTSSWQPDDDDNDGEYTGNYLAMEAFRYAATKSEDARRKAKQAFNFLKQLQEVTGSNGYFARTIVPIDWPYQLDDANRQFSERQLADEMVKEPRFKPVEIRWRKSVDGKWLWKGDASSDEMCGHMMGYFFYYQLVAEAEEKDTIRNHVMRIVDHLIANNFNMMDIDGKYTRWAVWSPDQLNRDPEWAPDRNQNSMEILSFLKLAYYVSGKKKYQQHYLRLIKEEHYLDNMAAIKDQNPAWFIYFDVMLQAYVYPILLHCEKDPALLKFYRQHMDAWMAKRKGDHNPLINFLYSYSRGKKFGLVESIEFLKNTPLDLVNWNIDHTKREDVNVVRDPVLDELQVNELPPPSIRLAIRWDKNPWTAVGGDPGIEREPVFWLLPYWIGKYLRMIE